MNTRAALLAACGALGCGSSGGDTCGAETPAPQEAALVTSGSESFRYGRFEATLGGDCPVETGSRGSVTIAGKQAVTDFPLTFCVRRENDVVSGEPISLADASFIEVVDVSARDAAGCTYAKDTGAVATGTITFDGFCLTDGTEYNLTLAGSIAGVRQCPASDGAPPTSTAVDLALAGTVRVVMIASEGR